MIPNKRKSHHPHLYHLQKESTKPSNNIDHKNKQAPKHKLMSSSSTTHLPKKIHQHAKKIQQFIPFHNQNQDMTNVFHKNKNQKFLMYHPESRDKSKKIMCKSSSMGKLNSKTFRKKSVSPINNNQQTNLKTKYNTKKLCRTDRDKSKKQLKVVKGTKRQQKNKNVSQKTTRHQSQHLKTQMSSKMPSVSKELDDKKIKRPSNKKKFTKSIKTKQVHCPQKKHKKKNPSIRQKIKDLVIYSQKKQYQNGSFIYSQIAARQNFYMPTPPQKQMSLEYKKMQKAVIMIQKNFRGYLTRKYLEEIKYMIHSVVKIQKIWRGYICRKKLKKQVNHKKSKNVLSIENSLITIKDFSEENREEKSKQKHFNFNIAEIENRRSIKFDLEEKRNIRSISDSKLVSILQNLLEQEELNEKLKDKIRVSLAESQSHRSISQSEQKKKQYIQNKINSQINSEKSFNSPRSLVSPKNSIPLVSPASHKVSIEPSIQKTPIDIFQSPRKKSDQQILKRLVSPVQKQQKLQSMKKEEADFQERQNKVHSFDTSFQFLQQFCLLIIDILREDDDQMNCFLNCLENCKIFRINLILKGWDKFYENDNIESSPIFAVLDNIQMPTIFSNEVYMKYCEYPSLKLLLQDGNYMLQKDNTNQNQKSCHDSFKNCIFDCFNQAMYSLFKNSFISFQNPQILIGQTLQNSSFKNVMLQSILSIRGWSQYNCGIYFEKCDEGYEQERFKRMEIMIRDQLKTQSFSQPESWIMWLKIMFGQIIFQNLVVELQEELAHILIQQNL